MPRRSDYRHSYIATVEEALARLSVDQLKALVRLLPTARRPSRKAELTAEIERHLAGDLLRKLWARLDETQQLAVREALHGPAGEFSPQQFRAKYGRLPAGAGVRRYDSAKVSRLSLFLYAPDFRSTNSVIPGDLASRLREFVAEAEAPTLSVCDDLPAAVALRRWRGSQETIEQVPLVLRDTEHTARHELPAVLRLIDAGKVAVSAKTMRPSAAAVRRIGEVLSGGDFFSARDGETASRSPMADPIRAHAWPWLMRAGKLAEPHGTKLALTRAGLAAFGAPQEKTLRRLWQRWITSTLLDEFNRVDVIKGQGGRGRRSMTSPAGRRPAIRAALAACPVGRWVSCDELGRFMRAAGHDFSVTRDPWNLYLFDPEYGSLGYDGYHDWEFLEGRYLLCVLFEYAATLGMIDVAYTDPHGARPDFTRLSGTDDLEFLSRYDGLHYVRLTALGAYCLGLTESYTPSTAEAGASLTVFPDLRVQVTGAPLTAAEALLLESYAKAESDGLWRLDHTRTVRAVEGGHEVAELRAFLTSRDDQDLPETVEGFLRDTEQRACALKQQGNALLIECADAEIAALLATDRRTAKLCLRAGERNLVVPAASERAFRNAIHALGYGMPRS